MKQEFEIQDVYDSNGKADRKNKIDLQRRIRELKEQQRLKKELDYYELDDDEDY